MMNKPLFSKNILSVIICLVLFSVLMNLISFPAKKSAEKARIRKYEIAKILFFEYEDFKSINKMIFREDISIYKRTINVSKNTEYEYGDFVFEDKYEKFHIKWHCIDQGIIKIDD